MRVLIVEDEVDLNNIINKKLKKEGYSTDCCFTGDDALDYIAVTDYDVIILDVMIPGKDGFEVVSEMKSNGNDTPVLFLTARDSVSDRVRGLDLGAEDYLIKPFSFDELMARLRVLTRRKTNNINNILTIADLEVDCNTHIVKRNGDIINLSAKEFALLEYLIRNQGIVLSRGQIENHIWSYDYEGESNMIDVYIRYLRKKIDDISDNKLIHTVRGVGYVLRDSNEIQ